MSDNTGHNLLEPGTDPQENHNFLLMVSIIVKAVERHAKMIRMSIGSASNDHRLGANEAPPSIISVFLGDTLDKIFQAILDQKEFSKSDNILLDFNANQLVQLLKDNTDRNRTSPFAFTGNKFEVRAVGSSQSVGFPATILNTAVADVMKEVNEVVERKLSEGKDVMALKNEIIHDLLKESYHVVFNGDGYSDDWVKEAEKRGLPNLRTTAEAVATLADPKAVQFLYDFNIFSELEVNSRYNVLIEQYCTQREIEFKTLANLIDQYVIPSAVNYKDKLLSVSVKQKELGIDSKVEIDLLNTISKSMAKIEKGKAKLLKEVEKEYKSEAEKALVIANKLLPLSEEVGEHCNTIESIVADNLWPLPKYYDMLFVR
jgi:glutamine synthetase